VPAHQSGLAAALITASSTLGGALGLAIFSGLATSRTTHQLAAHASPAGALTSGFRVALTACGVFLVAAAIIASRVRSSASMAAPPDAQPELAVEAA
jgi:hypothetical protein